MLGGLQLLGHDGVGRAIDDVACLPKTHAFEAQGFAAGFEAFGAVNGTSTCLRIKRGHNPEQIQIGHSGIGHVDHIFIPIPRFKVGTEDGFAFSPRFFAAFSCFWRPIEIDRTGHRIDSGYMVGTHHKVPSLLPHGDGQQRQSR